MYQKTIFSLILLFCSLNFLQVDSSKCQKCHPLSTDGKINVHLIPHSHDDVGWLRTVDEYYDDYVKYIISSTVAALKKDSSRRFIQVETAFFWKWWQSQGNEAREDFRNLVNSGQIEMVNGAWSMNDEATTNYQAIIDQFTLGFRILADTLGECGRPEIGWQIDPFGHSLEHASIAKRMGFKGLFLGRIDFRDKSRRKKMMNLEFFWSTSNNLIYSEIFTSILPNFYVYERDFCFDIFCEDNVTENNKKKKVKQFATILDEYNQFFETPNILVPMGGDFTYSNASINFDNTDSLIDGFKNHGTYHVFYSTPSCYVQAIQNNLHKIYSKKLNDFFPYASYEHSYWTGYFTSRPTLKRFERKANKVLQSIKQLATFSKILGKDYEESVTPLKEAMGVLQHHDAITGTSKQRVAEDYAKMLHEGIVKAEKPINVITKLLLNEKDINLKLSACLLSNVSICDVSKESSKFMVMVYNPLSHQVSHYVRLPVNKVNFNITGPDGQEIYDVFDAIHDFNYVKEKSKPATKELVFRARNVAPLGFKIYYLEEIFEIKNAYHPFKKFTHELDYEKFGTETKYFTINTINGRLDSMVLNNKRVEVEQDFLYYCGVDDDTSSGAYIFRPENSTAIPINATVTAKFARGMLVDQVLQYFSEEVSQIIRVYKEDDDINYDYIEFDWLVGDLHHEKTFGKEVITRFTVKDFINHGIFYTDSNGREMVRREKDWREDYSYDPTQEPVSSNYYPVTSKIVIKDEAKQLEVALLTDRSHGGTSLKNGTIELMVHRRLVVDDGWGVNEILNEVQYEKGLFVRGRHFFTFGSSNLLVEDGMSMAAFERVLSHRKLMEPLVLVENASVKKMGLLEFAGLKKDLPLNVKILTLEPWKNRLYVLRLEHVMEYEEDGNFSQAVTVNLENVFTLFNVTEIAETSLGVGVFNGIENLDWKEVYDVNNKENFLKISLNPMEIKTFLIKTTGIGDDVTGGGQSAKTSIFIFVVIFCFTAVNFI